MRYRAVLFDVMGTLIYEPFFVEVPRALGMSLRELMPLLQPGTWVDFETGAIDEAGLRAKFFRDRRDYPHEAMKAAMVDAYRFIDEFPVEAVAELHLGGFTPEDDEATPGGTLLVDTHAHAVAEPAWKLYAHALRRFGPQPTLIEWDNDVPALATLIDEAAKADWIREAAKEDRHAHTG